MTNKPTTKYNLFNQSFNTQEEMKYYIRSKKKHLKVITTPADENFDFLFDLLTLHGGQLKDPPLFVKDNIDCFQTYHNSYMGNCIEVIYKDGFRKNMITDIQKLLSAKYIESSNK